jgi:hypothetical protein
MNQPEINRREFLKLASLAALSSLGPQMYGSIPRQQAPEGSSNILIFVFDTMSARHL